jgi:hypothetical protein
MRAWQPPPRRWDRIAAWTGALVAAVVLLRALSGPLTHLLLGLGLGASAGSKLLIGLVHGALWVLVLWRILRPLSRELHPGRRAALDLAAGGACCAHCWGSFEPGDAVYPLDSLWLCEEHAKRLGVTESPRRFPVS